MSQVLSEEDGYFVIRRGNGRSYYRVAKDSISSEMIDALRADLGRMDGADRRRTLADTMRQPSAPMEPLVMPPARQTMPMPVREAEPFEPSLDPPREPLPPERGWSDLDEADEARPVAPQVMTVLDSAIKTDQTARASQQTAAATKESAAATKESLATAKESLRRQELKDRRDRIKSHHEEFEARLRQRRPEIPQFHIQASERPESRVPRTFEEELLRQRRGGRF